MAVDFEKNNKDRLPYLHYLELYAQKDPAEIAQRCRLKYDPQTKAFEIGLMQQRYSVTWPDLQVTQLTEGFDVLGDIKAKILILRYLVDGSYTESTGKYLCYRDFPWGDVYIQQFTGRCINRFAFSYAKRLDALEAAMTKLNAKKIGGCDVGYEIEFMDGLFVRYLFWQADEDFPCSAQILFSDNFALAFTAEDLANAGDVMIGAFNKV